MNTLWVSPISIRDANRYVSELHRHHKAVHGAKFAIACVRSHEMLGELLCGVVIVGRPVSRHVDDGRTAEVTRLCTDGTKNACSILYGSARRAAFAMGYRSIITYTLPEEGGASLRASGFKLCGESKGGEWSRPSRKRNASENTCVKHKWESIKL